MPVEAPTKPSSTNATLVGSTAILMWSALALLTTLTGEVPPFQLTAMAFSIAAAIGLVFWLSRGGDLDTFTGLPPKIWLLGVGGLFGFHFFYFMALRSAPVVEANLIVYLWPLLIVLLSSTLPGERLRWYHAVGGVVAFIGVAVLISGGNDVQFSWRYLPGYLAALASALTWSTYSVLSRRWGEVPTTAIGAFCAATAILAWISHFLTEPTVWPTGSQWLAVLGLGLGPVGLAFFVWDHGVKRGDIRALGALSYLAPPISTMLLLAAGKGKATWSLVVACILIVGGAVLAARDSFLTTGRYDSRSGG